MKLLTKIQAAAQLCAVSCPALADGVDYQTISDAASKTGDLSRQALVMIFGDVVISPFQPGQATLIGSLFATGKLFDRSCLTAFPNTSGST